VGYRLSDGDDDTIASIPNVMCLISHGDCHSMFSINTISATAGVGAPPFDIDVLVIRVVRPIVPKKGTTSSIASWARGSNPKRLPPREGVMQNVAN